MAGIPTILACDIGNHSLRIALVTGDDVTTPTSFRIDKLGALADALHDLWNQIDTDTPRKVVVSSCNGPALKVFEETVEDVIGEPAIVVGRDVPPPIDTQLPHPERIGTDRLCAAVAAFDRLGSACIVADFGTAITIDCINDEGQFMGGAILPGLNMSAKSLTDDTDKLPHVKLAQVDWVFGRDTHEAIVGGLVMGTRGALRHIVEAYATELGHWPNVIVTGGDAELICNDPSGQHIADAIVPDLVLRGVAMAYYRTLLK